MADPDRCKQLRQALAGLEGMVADAKRVKPKKGYDYRACSMAIEDVEAGSGSFSSRNLLIDIYTFRKIAPQLRKLILAELEAMRG